MNIIKNIVLIAIAVLGISIFAVSEAKAAGQIVFNNESGEKTLWVAKGTLGANDSGWGTSVSVEPGDTVSVKVFYHNTGNYDALNVKVSASPKNASKAFAHNISGSVTADNANPAYPANGGVIINVSQMESIDLVSGSVKWYPNKSNNSASLSGSEADLFAGGLNIGTIQSKYSCPPSTPDCREGAVVFQYAVSKTVNTPVYECNDGIDNDGDGLIDYPADPGCSSATDNDETDVVVLYQCNDGIDNDGDGLIDYPADPGCSSATDDDETDIVSGDNLTVDTLNATSIGENSAVLNASWDYVPENVQNGAGNNLFFFRFSGTNIILPIEEVDIHFQYGTSSNNLNMLTAVQTMSGDSGSIGIAINGLEDDTNYYFRAIASDDSISVQGDLESFRTDEDNSGGGGNNDEPTATTDVAYNIDEDSAVLRGLVNPNGSDTEYYFEYGTDRYDLDFETSDENMGSGDNTEVVLATIENLKADTKYYFRVVATNDNGTDRGSTRSFQTEKEDNNGGDINDPLAITAVATSVGTSAARLNGVVIIDGGLNTEAYFEWGSTTVLGNKTATKSIGSASTVSVTDTIAGLVSGKTYYFRLVAENDEGVDKGDIKSFRTGSIVIGGGGGGSVDIDGLIALKIETVFDEVESGDIINYTVTFENLGDKDIEDAILRVIFPEDIKFRKSTDGDFNKSENVLTVEIEKLEKDESNSITIQAEVLRGAKNEEILVTSALIVFTNPENDAQEDALAYSVLKVAEEDTNLLGAAGIFGSDTFLPDTLVEWLILILIVAGLAFLAQRLYTSRKGERGGNGRDSGGDDLNEDFKFQNIDGFEDFKLPTEDVPVSRYAQGN